jgi:hypothetical protein
MVELYHANRWQTRWGTAILEAQVCGPPVSEVHKTAIWVLESALGVAQLRSVQRSGVLPHEVEQSPFAIFASYITAESVLRR